MVDIRGFLPPHMHYTQAKHVDNANAYKIPAPAFRPDGLVSLDRAQGRVIACEQAWR